MKRFVYACALGLLTWMSLRADAHAQAYAPPYQAPQTYPPAQPSQREIVFAYNTGSRFSIAPGVFLPTDGGRVGFSIAGDYRYGVPIGPVVLAPGVRLAGFFPSGYVALTALATGRLTIPIGPVGPYVMGGIGPGYTTKPSEAGAAFLGGGGVMVYIGTTLGIGVEATYLGITGSQFRALFIGPSLLLGF